MLDGINGLHNWIFLTPLVGKIPKVSDHYIGHVVNIWHAVKTFF